jgi:hypothetical protein
MPGGRRPPSSRVLGSRQFRKGETTDLVSRFPSRRQVSTADVALFAASWPDSHSCHLSRDVVYHDTVDSVRVRSFGPQVLGILLSLAEAELRDPLRPDLRRWWCGGHVP